MKNVWYPCLCVCNKEYHIAYCTGESAGFHFLNAVRGLQYFYGYLTVETSVCMYIGMVCVCT